MARHPYKVKNYTFDPLTGRGEVLFNDGERLHFTRRMSSVGYKWRLVSPVYETPISSPPRMRNLVAAVSAREVAQ